MSGSRALSFVGHHLPDPAGFGTVVSEATQPSISSRRVPPLLLEDLQTPLLDGIAQQPVLDHPGSGQPSRRRSQLLDVVTECHPKTMRQAIWCIAPIKIRLSASSEFVGARRCRRRRPLIWGNRSGPAGAPAVDLRIPGALRAVRATRRWLRVRTKPVHSARGASGHNRAGQAAGNAFLAATTIQFRPSDFASRRAPSATAIASGSA